MLTVEGPAVLYEVEVRQTGVGIGTGVLPWRPMLRVVPGGGGAMGRVTFASAAEARAFLRRADPSLVRVVRVRPDGRREVMD